MITFPSKGNLIPVRTRIYLSSMVRAVLSSLPTPTQHHQMGLDDSLATVSGWKILYEVLTFSL